MYIDRLKLTNYRNYESLDLSFSPKINVFLGENAQGKQMLWNLYMFYRWQNRIVPRMRKN